MTALHDCWGLHDCLECIHSYNDGNRIECEKGHPTSAFKDCEDYE